MATATTYHDVIRYEITDRRGFEPRIESGSVADALAQEHDHVLLIFARSPSLRAAAATAAEVWERLISDSPSGAGALTAHHMCRMLAGLPAANRAHAGYITYAAAFHAVTAPGQAAYG